MSYHSKRVTVRFTTAEFVMLQFAASKIPTFGQRTPSRLIRIAVREKIQAMGLTEDDLKSEMTAQLGAGPSSDKRAARRKR